MKYRIEKPNDRPRDTFSGEAGDDRSLPRGKENSTAPKRVACQSLADRTAKKTITIKKGRYFCLWQEKFLCASMRLRRSWAYPYKLIRELNEELRKTGCITIAGRIDRKFFHEKFYGTREQKERKESNGSV